MKPSLWVLSILILKVISFEGDLNPCSYERRSCESIKADYPGSEDGYYWIDGCDVRNILVWCHDMDGNPREYIDLKPGTYSEISYGDFDLDRNDTIDGSFERTVRTTYERVRLYPLGCRVSLTDRTFATSEGWLISPSGHNITWAPFASVEACEMDANLTTGVTAEYNIEFYTDYWRPGKFADLSPNEEYKFSIFGQLVDLFTFSQLNSNGAYSVSLTASHVSLTANDGNNCTSYSLHASGLNSVTELVEKVDFGDEYYTSLYPYPVMPIEDSEGVGQDLIRCPKQPPNYCPMCTDNQVSPYQIAIDGNRIDWPSAISGQIFDLPSDSRLPIEIFVANSDTMLMIRINSSVHAIYIDYDNNNTSGDQLAENLDWKCPGNPITGESICFSEQNNLTGVEFRLTDFDTNGLVNFSSHLSGFWVDETTPGYGISGHYQTLEVAIPLEYEMFPKIVLWIQIEESSPLIYPFSFDIWPLYDCQGVYGGHDFDSCTDCKGIMNGTDISCLDCSGVKFGSDNSCRDCVGTLNGTARYCADCDGVINGTNFDCKECPGGVGLDICGVCNGDGSTCCHEFLGIPNTIWNWIILREKISELLETFENLNSQFDCSIKTMPSYDECGGDGSIVPMKEALASLHLRDFAHHHTEFLQDCLWTYKGLIRKWTNDITPLNL